MRPSSISKLLSSNDTGETGGHQAGILIPKGGDVLEFFPELDASVKNPRFTLAFSDEVNQCWKFNYIYYNSRFFGGTRNEYRLTGMTSYIRQNNLKAGDTIILTRTSDVHDKNTRSYNMSRIHNKDTKPEEMVRKYLFAHGFRYRKNDKRLPGKPDIVLPKYKTCILINGCFWHGHDCELFVWPKTNSEFWHEKITSNISRDSAQIAKLESMGWNVIVIWECNLRPNYRDNTLSRLIAELRNYIND